MIRFASPDGGQTFSNISGVLVCLREQQGESRIIARCGEPEYMVSPARPANPHVGGNWRIEEGVVENAVQAMVLGQQIALAYAAMAQVDLLIGLLTAHSGALRVKD